ncbi:hypothetical protein FHS55_002596 [Angulomicrobium tetraedrale]|uniref:Uncharacterized protein n=1 Tax=Ancylobacter tetraedralis TaxID=217068 RepID=A0A839ZB85_9HYPH|nr:hypothetical protein [Ancylobacter tetraedralis]MBB3771987.1 hypothetical protein [Ancylobacter tetraedralis]
MQAKLRLGLPRWMQGRFAITAGDGVLKDEPSGALGLLVNSICADWAERPVDGARNAGRSTSIAWLKSYEKNTSHIPIKSPFLAKNLCFAMI